MNMHETHPDSEQLDSLRAGLLDDEPRLKAGIEAHLHSCESCRKRHDWFGHLRPGGLPIVAAGEQLNVLRRQALKTTTAGQRLLPFAAAAALALVVVVLVKPSPQDNRADTRMAQTSMEAEATPVLYEDLDFYLWLSDRKEDADSST